MPLPGGATDKYGNRYEGRWTAFCMAQILDENACSIRLEPPGVEDKGFEFWLRRKDRIEYHQVKRQKSRGGGWTLQNLENESILQNFGDKLGAAQGNYCVFISTQSAPELDNLADKARRYKSFEEFKNEFIKSKEHSKSFSNLRQIWEYRSEEESFDYLKGIYIRTIDEDTLNTALKKNPSTILRESILERLMKIHWRPLSKIFSSH